MNKEINIGMLNTLSFRVVLQNDPRISELDAYSICSVKKLRCLPEYRETFPYLLLIQKAITVRSVIDLLRKWSVREKMLVAFLPSMKIDDCVWKPLATWGEEGDLIIEVIMGHRSLVDRAFRELANSSAIRVDPLMLANQSAVRKFMRGM